MHQSSASLDLCLRKTWTGKSHDFRDVIVFEKLFSKCFLHTKMQGWRFQILPV